VRVTLAWKERTLPAGKRSPSAWGWGPVKTIAEGRKLLHPALSLSPGGELAVAWQRGGRGENSSVFFQRRLPDAVAFEPPHRVSCSGAVAAYADLAYTLDKRLFIAYQTGAHNLLGTRLEICEMKNGGQGKADLLGGASDKPARFARLAPVGKNGLAVAWDEAAGLERNTRIARLEHGRWSDPFMVPGVLPSIAGEKNGVLHALAKSIDTHYFRIGQDGEIEKLFLAPAWIRCVGGSDIAIGEDGVLYAVWGAHRNGEWCSILLRAKQPGLAWSRVQALSDPAQTNAQYPSIAVAGKTLHVAWIDHREGHPAVYWKEFDGRAWSPDVRLSEPGITAEYPKIAADKNGVHAVWYELKGERPGIKMREIFR
jgi:hypothetical protein